MMGAAVLPDPRTIFATMMLAAASMLVVRRSRSTPTVERIEAHYTNEVRLPSGESLPHIERLRAWKRSFHSLNDDTSQSLNTSQGKSLNPLLAIVGANPPLERPPVSESDLFASS